MCARASTWNNGDAFNADDVIFNFTRWCREEAPKATRCPAAWARWSTTATGKLREGAITKVDDITVKLKLTEPDIALIPEHLRLSGPDRAPQLRRERAATSSRHPIGTGPFELVSYDVGQKVVYKRRENGKWWDGEAYLDGVEFIDYGTDPSAMVSAFEAGEVHTNYETAADYVSILDGLGAGQVGSRHRGDDRGAHERHQQALRRPEGAQRAAARGRQCRRAAARLRQCRHGGGKPPCLPIHPEYVELPKVARDIEKAKALMAEAGQADFEHELITVDEDWHKNTGDAIAAQMRDAGIKVKRTVLPGSTFWNDWTVDEVSLLDDQLEHASARRPGLALAYRTGEAWNETA